MFKKLRKINEKCSFVSDDIYIYILYKQLKSRKELFIKFLATEEGFVH